MVSTNASADPTRDPARPGLSEHLDRSRTPKRLLSLDGGGVRGIVTLQFLKRIEALLRERRGDPDYVLADYFDLIAGTSTGAIIAAGLALGFPVERIERHYRDLASRIFRRRLLGLGILRSRFARGALRQALQETFGAETKLSSDALRTGLLVMTKRMDTGSPWPLTNHPEDPYFQPCRGKRRIGNANMLLWQVVRASTAAPLYFRPERLDVGYALDPATGKTLVDRGLFVDGGVSTANNPALQALQAALLEGFAFRWTAGADNVLLVSVGTGLASRRTRPRWWSSLAAPFAMNALLSLMDDCNDAVELQLQWLSESPTARRLDGQVRRLENDLLARPALLSYLRYNVHFEGGWLRDALGIDVDPRRVERLSELDRPENMDELARLGTAAAARQIEPAHLPARFDP